MLKTLTMLVLALCAATASAQVFRCQDASGKLTFSDRPCGAGQSGVMVQRERSEADLMMERQQAYEAEQRKQERRWAEQEREWAEQQQRAMQPMPEPVVRHSGNDWQTRKNLENARTSAGSIMNNGGRFDQAAEAQRERERKEEARRRAAADPPTRITNCNGGFCYDDRGTPYSRNGPELIRSSDGSVCRVVGGMTQCN